MNLDPEGSVITRVGSALIRKALSGFLSTIKYWTASESPALNWARNAFFSPALVNPARIANETVPSTSNGPLAAVVSESNKVTGWWAYATPLLKTRKVVTRINNLRTSK